MCKYCRIQMYNYSFHSNIEAIDLGYSDIKGACRLQYSFNGLFYALIVHPIYWFIACSEINCGLCNCCTVVSFSRLDVRQWSIAWNSIFNTHVMRRMRTSVIHQLVISEIIEVARVQLCTFEIMPFIRGESVLSDISSQLILSPRVNWNDQWCHKCWFWRWAAMLML